MRVLWTGNGFGALTGGVKGPIIGGLPATGMHNRTGAIDGNQRDVLGLPAYLDRHGALRGGLPAEVEYRYAVGSSDGPLESAKIQCPRGHWFNGPIESLTLPKPQDQAVPRPAGTHASRATGQPATRAHTEVPGETCLNRRAQRR